ncbi:MAG: alpha/beta hydrolase [Gordonia polyisoprenivorans]|nr:alpha/beta hydrolase [Gordonia polyisoprenivorans]
MHFTSERVLDDGIAEREFTLGDFTGILWTPPAASGSTPVPLIVLGQPGSIGTRHMYPRLAARARRAAADGFAAVTIEPPGAGDRTPLPGADLIDRLVLPLLEQAVPECRITLDEILGRPEIGDKVGLSGGVIAVGTRLAAVDPRIAAAGLFAGSYVPSVTMEEARLVTAPLHVLLQWDDESNDRRMALDLFDAFGSTEKTLCANMGGHTGVPQFAGEEAARFFVRHLGSDAG